MTRADWEAATPKCPKGEGAGLPVCGEPMRWEPWTLDEASGAELGRWVCPPHGPQLSGEEAAVRAGFAMSFAGAS